MAQQKPASAENKAADGALPLSSITIVDLTHVIAGPFASMILADLGATVLKIEAPGRGDTARGTPPHDDGISHFFAAVNRNKHSVSLNIKHPRGKAFLDQLIAQADVLIHNFRPGVMETLGLGHETLAKTNPGLVYCAISGFGQVSPLRDRPAFDGVIQAMSGLMSLTGEADGPPVRAGLSVGDFIPGLYAAMAIVVAIREKERHGKGQYLDVSNFDCLFNILGYYVPYYELTGKVPLRTGGAHPTVVPMGGFPSADGHIVVAAFNQGFWRNLCGALDRPQWLEDPRYATLTTRAQHSAPLFKELCEVMKQKTTAEWEVIFQAHDVPCGPVLNVADLVEHPQVKQRELLESLGRGRMRVPVRPVKYEKFRESVRKPPPHLGEDTIAVLQRYGCIAGDEAELRVLAGQGVVEDTRFPAEAAAAAEARKGESRKKARQ